MPESVQVLSGRAIELVKRLGSCCGFAKAAQTWEEEWPRSWRWEGKRENSEVKAEEQLGILKVRKGRSKHKKS